MRDLRARFPYSFQQEPRRGHLTLVFVAIVLVVVATAAIYRMSAQPAQAPVVSNDRLPTVKTAQAG